MRKYSRICSISLLLSISEPWLAYPGGVKVVSRVEGGVFDVVSKLLSNVPTLLILAQRNQMKASPSAIDVREPDLNAWVTNGNASGETLRVHHSQTLKHLHLNPEM